MNDKPDEQTHALWIKSIPAVYGERPKELCLRLFQKGADYAGLPFALESVAALARAKNQWEKAARIFGAADALRKRTHTPLPPPHHSTHQMNLSILQQQLDPTTFAMAWMEGSAMTMDQAIMYALEK